MIFSHNHQGDAVDHQRHHHHRSRNLRQHQQQYQHHHKAHKQASCKFFRRGSFEFSNQQTMMHIAKPSAPNRIPHDPVSIGSKNVPGVSGASSHVMTSVCLQLLREPKVQLSLQQIADRAAHVISHTPKTNITSEERTQPNHVEVSISTMVATLTSIASTKLAALITAALTSSVPPTTTNDCNSSSNMAHASKNNMHFSDYPISMKSINKNNQPGNNINAHDNHLNSNNNDNNNGNNEVPNLDRKRKAITPPLSISQQVPDIEVTSASPTQRSNSLPETPCSRFTDFKRPLKRFRKGPSALNLDPSQSPSFSSTLGSSSTKLSSSYSSSSSSSKSVSRGSATPPMTPPTTPQFSRFPSEHQSASGTGVDHAVSAVKSLAIAGVTKIVALTAAETARAMAISTKERIKRGDASSNAIENERKRKQAYVSMRNITINAAAYLTGTIHGQISELAIRLKQTTHHTTANKEVTELLTQLLKTDSINKIILKATSLLQAKLIQHTVDVKEAIALSSTVTLLVRARADKDSSSSCASQTNSKHSNLNSSPQSRQHQPPKIDPVESAVLSKHSIHTKRRQNVLSCANSTISIKTGQLDCKPLKDECNLPNLTPAWAAIGKK